MKPVSQCHRIIQKANVLHEDLAPMVPQLVEDVIALLSLVFSDVSLSSACCAARISILHCHLIASVDIMGGRMGLLSRTRSRSNMTAADNLGTICLDHIIVCQILCVVFLLKNKTHVMLSCNFNLVRIKDELTLIRIQY